MKNLNFIFKLLLFHFLFVLFSASLYADTFEIRVSAGNDDAEERTNDHSMYRNSSDLELVYDGNRKQEVGMRFTNVAIPNNATITNAYIQFTVDETDSGTTNVVIYGQNTDDAVAFSSASSNISSRATTSASAAWNIPVWNSIGASGADQRTPSLSSVVQEIVNRGGWSSGNNMVFIVKAGSGCSDSSCQRTAESYDGSSSKAALLHIEYTIAPANVCTGVHGLTGVYYNNRTFTDPVVLTRVDSNIDFEWGSGSPAAGINIDDFSTAWAGTIYIPEDGTYTFSFAHDDVIKLIIDGATIYDNSTWTGGASHFRDATPVALTAGTYPVNVSFIEWGGGAYAKLAWRNDVSISSQTIIPSENFCTTATAVNVIAVDDVYSTFMDSSLSIDAASGLLDNDIGVAIGVTTNTTPANGTILIQPNGSFLYTPDTSFVGTDTFTYTISDGTTQDTATVTIEVTNQTTYPTNLGFELINPGTTRNVIGDYAISGNTVLCLTNLTSGYATSESQCLDTTTPGTRTSNNYVAKYIDIDGDNSTWNSSSSNITLPTIYEQNGGDGILWAGLIWQGRFVWDGSRKSLHYHVDQGATFTTVETGGTSTKPAVTLTDANTNSIRLKVDTGSYAPVTAQKVYSLASSGGITYTSIADVTSILRNANLASGKHTFTVANLPTEEGRENSPGVYGGWSLVVIYAEEVLNGTPKNISIYGGMDILRGKTDPANLPIEITGFKLPSSGNTVTASLSIFSGEGELPYTPDGVQISDAVNGTYVNMPTSSSQTNIFDAVMNNIDRDNVSGHMNNLQNNNVGIDVDNFNISNIVSGYDRGITSLFLKWYSGNGSNSSDYIIPGMIAFSTELYQPNLCYDYTYDIGGYVLESENNEVNTSYHHLNNTLTTHVSIRSLEGDFDLTNAQFKVTSIPEYMSYKPGTAALAPNLIYGYTNVPIYKLDDPAPSSFTMDVGENIIAGSGGTIQSFQTTYTRFQHEMNTSKVIISTALSMQLSYTVNYGSGPVPQVKNFDAAAYCSGGGAYAPVFGQFNIVGEGADSDEYNLVTQVSDRSYNVKAYGYDVDNVSTKSFDTAIEVEIFNANFFENDTTLSCHNPDSNVTQPIFIQFNGTSSVDITAQQYNVAQRNAGYRVWYLTKLDGSIVEHHAIDRNDGAYFQGIYTANYSGDTLCSSACNGGSGCYTCLRKYYGKPVCSRDNFSIRPEAFSMQLNDGATPITQNNTAAQFSIAGGYNYIMAVNAVAFGSNTPAGHYVKGFGAISPYATPINPATYDGATMMNGFTGNASCNDTNSEDFSFTFWDGSAVNNALSTRNVGAYTFHMLDTTWTAVDQTGNSGCTQGSADIPASGLVGCNIGSNYTNAATGTRFYDISLLSLPYKFDMTNILYTTQATANNYVYSNTLRVLPNPIIDNNMSISFTGDIEAQGQDNTPMTNYTTGCYAQDIQLDYLSASVPVAPLDINGNPLTLRWYERLASDVLTDAPIGTDGAVGPVVQGPKLLAVNFTQVRQGRSQVDLRINYDRQTNVPHNPFALTSTSLDAECDVIANCTMNAGNVATYTPNSTFNSRTAYGNVATVLYSRVNAPRKRVMCDSSSGSCGGTAQYFYEFYANQAADQTPATRALITAILPDAIRQRSLDSANWYRNFQHTFTEGQVTNPVTSGSLIEGASAMQNGVQTINYTYSGARGYPFKDTLRVQRNVNVQPWLIYDPYVAAATRSSSPIEYYGPGSWKSSGGQKASTGAKQKTNRRIRW